MDRFIELAMENALKSDMKNRLGAVALSGKSVISTGYNYGRDFRYSGKRGNSTHAELSALMNVPNNKKNKITTLIVVQITAHGSLKISKPCKRCEKMLEIYGVKKIYFVN